MGLQGTQVTHCNCEVGCPCQFNALPSHGHRRAYMFMQVEEGYFGEVKLDGVRWGGLFVAGPIHMGNGSGMTVVDERANAGQRRDRGHRHWPETGPGKLITQVFSTGLKRYDTVQADRARHRQEEAHGARAGG
jgi:hypothetical protein